MNIEFEKMNEGKLELFLKATLKAVKKSITEEEKKCTTQAK